MTNIILTGATGNAGSAMLTAALASPSISHVTVLARRAPAVSHDKLTTIIVPSAEYPRGFDELPPGLIERLRGNEAVVWALGVSQRDVSKDEYIKITYDYTMEAAKAFAPLGTPAKPFRFIYVSGMGADQAEKTWTLFGKIKGRAEKALADAETESFKTVSLRPAGIIPTPEHAPNVPFLTRLAGSSIGYVMPSLVIQSSELADAALALATGKGWGARDAEHVIDNGGLKRLADEYVKQMAPA